MGDFILFNIAVDSNGFHILLLDFLEGGALLRIGFDADHKTFGLHLFVIDLFLPKPYKS